MATVPQAALTMAEVHEFFRLLSENFDADAVTVDSSREPSTICIIVDSETWFIDVNPGATPAVRRDGGEDNPTPKATLRCSLEVLTDIMKGKTRPATAFLRRKITLSGDRSTFTPIAPTMLKTAKQLREAMAASVEPPPPADVLIDIQDELLFLDKNFWEPDGPSCRLCNARFSPAKWRHHCRLCGVVCCHQCSKQRLFGQRACRECTQTLVSSIAPAKRRSQICSDTYRSLVLEKTRGSSTEVGGREGMLRERARTELLGSQRTQGGRSALVGSDLHTAVGGSARFSLGAVPTRGGGGAPVSLATLHQNNQSNGNSLVVGGGGGRGPPSVASWIEEADRERGQHRERGAAGVGLESATGGAGGGGRDVGRGEEADLSPGRSVLVRFWRHRIKRLFENPILCRSGKGGGVLSETQRLLDKVRMLEKRIEELGKGGASGIFGWLWHSVVEGWLGFPQSFLGRCFWTVEHFLGISLCLLCLRTLLFPGQSPSVLLTEFVLAFLTILILCGWTTKGVLPGAAGIFFLPAVWGGAEFGVSMAGLEEIGSVVKGSFRAHWSALEGAAESEGRNLLIAVSVCLWVLVVLPLVYFRRQVVRGYDIYRTAGTAIFVYTVTYMRLNKWRKQKAPEEQQDAAFEAVDRWMAPFVAEGLIRLQSVFVKFGQYISGRTDIIPPRFSDHFARLQDDLPACPPSYVRRVVRQELGQRLETLFENFEFKPIASASIAQVHKAVLRGDGTAVVVKVQHRGIDSLMRRDMEDAAFIARIIRYIGGEEKYGVLVTVLTAWRDLIMENELDFRCEADNLIAVGAAIREAGFTDVKVPETRGAKFERLRSRRILTMEFVEGFKVTDMERLASAGVDREELMKRVVQAYSLQLYTTGRFNADPHPGNLMVQLDFPRTGVASLVLLDFGMCVDIPDSDRIAYCRLVRALSEFDMHGAAAALRAVGYANSQSEENPERDLEFFRFLMRDTQSSKGETRKETREFFEMRRKQRDADKEKGQHKSRYIARIPESLLFVFRVLGLIRGLCTELGVAVPYLDLMASFARQALCEHVARLSVPPHPSELSPRSHREEEEGGTKLALHWISHGSGQMPLSRGAGLNDTSLTERLARVCADACREGETSGVQIAVVRGGRLEVDLSVGVQGGEDPRELTSSTVMPLLDISKFILASHLHVLHCDEGTPLDLYATLCSSSWPQFLKGRGERDELQRERGGHRRGRESERDAAKRNISIAHFLANSAGMAFAFRGLSGREMRDLTGLASRLCEARPDTEGFPGPFNHEGRPPRVVEEAKSHNHVGAVVAIREICRLSGSPAEGAAAGTTEAGVEFPFSFEQVHRDLTERISSPLNVPSSELSASFSSSSIKKETQTEEGAAQRGDGVFPPPCGIASLSNGIAEQVQRMMAEGGSPDVLSMLSAGPPRQNSSASLPSREMGGQGEGEADEEEEDGEEEGAEGVSEGSVPASASSSSSHTAETRSPGAGGRKGVSSSAGMSQPGGAGAGAAVAGKFSASGGPFASSPEVTIDPCALNSPDVRRNPPPGLSMFGSARAVAQVLAGVWEQGGPRRAAQHAAGAETTSRLGVSRSHVMKACGGVVAVEDSVIFGHRRWGLGMEILRGDDDASPSTDLCIGMQSLGGSLAFVFPFRQVSVSILVNKLSLDLSLRNRIATEICGALALPPPSCAEESGGVF
uniref:FYVE-type domain-containing protein n=1 Tax=Chromera velia CCMP2878 TaxID=1169474 RepID=A0A0G4HLH0_9ALVE|eukprot:Cvel_28739.t1-p1 / transcript=Cvel_28739.t1 / gene=Cvel_28739 / organism=Chromera_velia_CCMP2878 / gene_product=Probable ubiquinone biosynthesis protein UbiB, putative / transcript_product=Probable ubiquinone biosynthesis protein UbiB, putative / location=Cvel_scaffold3820:2059-11760(+) / protein_length=1681 / sequence_SO=supercontig / SO=protein_coding / is_pseudo=false